MSSLNPEDFIITRKRKKYKFALFHNSEICFEHEQWGNAWRTDVIELGAGNGLFSVEMALRHPDVNFVAIDVKADRLQKGALKAEELNLTNIRFLRTRADLIGELFGSDSIAAVWLTFPDPFPKDKSAKHRLTHPRYLSIYKTIMKPSGYLYFKHDNLTFFNYSLEQLVGDGWALNELSFDLHESDLSDDCKILTTYEKRWLSEGLKTNFVKVKRP